MAVSDLDVMPGIVSVATLWPRRLKFKTTTLPGIALDGATSKSRGLLCLTVLQSSYSRIPWNEPQGEAKILDAIPLRVASYSETLNSK